MSAPNGLSSVTDGDLGIGIAPDQLAYMGQIRFVCNAFGKPHLSPAFGSRLKFNLSHSAGLALIAIAADSNIGIDLEYTPGRNLITPKSRGASSQQLKSTI
jgi:phosphopantetheinyl transferase